MAKIGPCDAIITALTNVSPDPFAKFPESGAIMSLLDPANNVGENPTPGKADGFVSVDSNGNPTVKVKNYPRITTASRTTKSCDVLANSTLTEDLVTLTKFREQATQVTFDEMRELCDQAAQVVSSGMDGIVYNAPNTPLMNEIRHRLLAAVKALVRDIDNDLVDLFINQWGTNARAGNSVAQFLDLFDANNNPTSEAYAQVKLDMMKSGLLGTPILLGGDDLAKYGMKLQWACCSDGGVDAGRAAQQNAWRYYYDPNIDTSWGDGHFAVIAPQSVKLISWPKNQGSNFQRRHGTSYFGSMIIPEFPGVEFDFHVKEEDCTEPSYILMPSLHFDLYVSPSPYASGDRLEGVNGLLRYSSKTAASVSGT